MTSQELDPTAEDQVFNILDFGCMVSNQKP